MSARAAARISFSVDGGVLTTSAAHRLICLSNFDAVFFHLKKRRDKEAVLGSRHQVHNRIENLTFIEKSSTELDVCL